MTTVWHHFVGLADEGWKTAVVEALAQAGLTTSALDRDAPSGPGVLFIDHFNQRYYDLLREISVNGLQRVLVIAPTRSALSGCDAWRLLEAGASDVFTWDHSDSAAAEVAQRFERW